MFMTRKMRKNIFALLAVCSIMTLFSCSDNDSYADQKARERTAINRFLKDSAVTVISETDFIANNEVTDVSKNEYVLFESSGVYMQIVRSGCGDKIKDGETTTVLCRFSEKNLLTDSLQISNNVHYFALNPDKLSVTNTSGTFEASFISGVMLTIYKSAAVPEGWLVPLRYIKVGRPQTADEEIAKVKLIVPHTKGQKSAFTGVYPCYYEITYERGK